MALGIRERRREATRGEILDAAWDLARARGLAGISLKDVAAAVGMQAPSLYSYFASKNAIYDAMFAAGYAQLLARVEGIEARSLHDVARVFIELCVEDPVRYQLLFQRTIPGFEPSVESFAAAQQFYERGRQEVAKHGLTTQADLDLWTALMTGLTDQQISNDPGGDRWLRLVDEAVDMLLLHKHSAKRPR